ncbi:Hypothetical predicted protein, partial [Pelobates cultripes]
KVSPFCYRIRVLADARVVSPERIPSDPLATWAPWEGPIEVANAMERWDSPSLGIS